MPRRKSSKQNLRMKVHYDKMEEDSANCIDADNAMIFEEGEMGKSETKSSGPMINLPN